MLVSQERQTESALARLLLSGCDDPSVHQFVATLLLAAKNGHLCLTIDEDIFPDLESLWFQAYGPGHGVDPKTLREGAKSCPKALIANVLDESPLKPLCRENNRYYLQRLWKCETIFKRHYQRLLSSLPTLKIHSVDVDKEIQGLALTDEQKAAIKASIGSCLSIISGGPGTGKTYTAGLLIKVLWNSLTEKQKETMRFILAAPTGKAAQNLQKSFQRAFQSLQGIHPLKAKTLHSVLGVKPKTLLEHPAYLAADVIIVDECSMIDVQMMANLMASVKSGARLILLGDSHQLPPVEAGSLFSDMMEMKGSTSLLSKCLRTESKGIIELSGAIYRGEDSMQQIDGVRRLEFSCDNEWKARDQIVDWSCKHYPKSPPETITPEIFTKFLQSYCLLSPLRKGPLGVDELNEQIMIKLSGKPAIPIIITKSSQEFNLFNGDMGILINNDKALFLNEEGSLRQISKLLLPGYEYAFCMSVHKSQGSEFDHVTLLMPKGSEIFGREVFYTGVTRARKQLDIWGRDETLKAAIKKKTMRNSGLVDLVGK